jgi:cAMP-dependent protein kinase regulator
MGCHGSKQVNAVAEPHAEATTFASHVARVADVTTGNVVSLLNPQVAMSTIRPITAEIKKKGHHLRNIFAKPLFDLMFDVYTPPVHPKTEAEKTFIEASLAKNFVFECLSPQEMKPLTDAFEKWSADAHEIIIQQGDADGEYFYIVEAGTCNFIVDEKKVGIAVPGDSFGELALLYTCPRAATVQADSTAVDLYRVNQKTFRYILKKQTEKGQRDKTELLKGVSFLDELSSEQRDKLSRVMKPKVLKAGEYVMEKGDVGDYFYILKEGIVKATDIVVGNAKYEDVELNPGQYFGERALLTGEPRQANVVAVTDGLAFCIDKHTFEAVLGNYNKLILRSQDMLRLSAIKCFTDSQLDSFTLSSLAKLVTDIELEKGMTLTVKGKPGLAALYLVRGGKIQIVGDESRILERGAFFGDDFLLADRTSPGRPTNPNKIVAAYTATVVEDCTIGVLTLASVRLILDTTFLGTPCSPNDATRRLSIHPSELKRHRMLGAGTFGQVWLVSRKGSDGKVVAYALKVQSKYELCTDGQAKAVVHEKNIMAKLSHPFLIGLVASYQDDDYVYMVMELVQGGELYNVLHSPLMDGIPEKDARFYIAGISEGLGYMHRRGYGTLLGMKSFVCNREGTNTYFWYQCTEI